MKTHVGSPLFRRKERAVGRVPDMRNAMVLTVLLAAVATSCTPAMPKISPDVQALFLPAARSLRHQRGISDIDIAKIQTEATRALLHSVGNDRQKLLLQWMFYVNGSPQAKKDLGGKGEDGWVNAMVFVYYFRFTESEIRNALRLFPDPIRPELAEEHFFEGMIRVANENGW